MNCAPATPRRPRSRGQPDASASSQWGFAAQGGLKVNLPNLSDADAMILQATYARGASAYLTGDSQPLFAGVNDPAHPGIAIPRLGASPGLTSYDYDCVTVAQPFGHCDQSSGYALVAAFKHFWTPTVSSSLFASYFGMNYSDAARAGAPGINGGEQLSRDLRRRQPDLDAPEKPDGRGRGRIYPG